MPAPKHTSGNLSREDLYILAGGVRIATVHVAQVGRAPEVEAEEAYANADRIIRAVNAHEELVAALTRLADSAENYKGSAFAEDVAAARAALAKANPEARQSFGQAAVETGVRLCSNCGCPNGEVTDPPRACTYCPAPGVPTTPRAGLAHGCTHLVEECCPGRKVCIHGVSCTHGCCCHACWDGNCPEAA